MTPKARPSHAAERLALMLTENGMQRMTARVLATLLFTDRTTLTMADLADELKASSGAMSGSLRSLVAVGLVERVPAAGDRREHYRLRDNAWAVLFTAQNDTLTAMRAAADEGLEDVPRTSPAHHRLTQMRGFYAFLAEEMPAVLQRWEQLQSKASVRSKRGG